MNEQKDWSKATDEELIAEAKRRYPIGTEIKSVYGTNHTISFDFVMQDKALYAGSTSHSICVYSPSLNQWAEIISQPKEETDHQGQPIKYFGGLEENNRPEPKAGDMVEVSDNGEDYSKYSHRTHKYLGVKRFYDGFFVVENQDGFISCHPFIRLPQKSEVESKIEELCKVSENTVAPLKVLFKEAIKWGQANPNKK